MIRTLGRSLVWGLAQVLWCSAWAVQSVWAQVAGGHYEAIGLPVVVRDSLIKAIGRNDIWRLPEEAFPKGAGPTGPQRLLWSGSDIAAGVIVGAPTIRFQKVDNPAESFEVVVSREPTRVIIRSSAPASPALAAGIIAPLIQVESFFKFIPGANDTGFVALIPKTLPGDWFVVALCPVLREPDGVAYRFTPSGYEVAAVRFEPKGEVSARLETGQSVGAARISILTTPNIPRAVNFERSVEQQAPRISGIYFADSADTSAALQLQPFAGIQIRGELTSPTQSKRIKQIEGVVQAQPFDLPSPIEISQDGRKSSFQGKNCVAIIRGIISQEEFRDP